MATRRAFCQFLVASSVAASGAAGVTGFAIVNQTGVALNGVEIRRVGATEWQPLSASPSAGARSVVAFKDPDCAFDLRGVVAGAGPAVWRGVNLCDVKSVTLNRDKSGRTWVDYD